MWITLLFFSRRALWHRMWWHSWSVPLEGWSTATWLWTRKRRSRLFLLERLIKFWDRHLKKATFHRWVNEQNVVHEISHCTCMLHNLYLKYRLYLNLKMCGRFTWDWSHLFICAHMYTQDLQPIDFSAWNSYADPKFVFYDRELVRKCQCADPVSLAALEH